MKNISYPQNARDLLWWTELKGKVKAYFKDNVSVVDTTTTLKALELTYWREKETSIADGNVEIIDPVNSITLWSEHFENDKLNGISLLTGHPRAIQIDSTTDSTMDTLVVTSDTMISYQDSLQRLITSGHVEIVRTGLAAEAGECLMITKLDSLILNNSPIVWYKQSNAETTQVSGDSLFIKLKKRKLETLTVRGNALVVSQVDSVRTSRYNQMSGGDLVMNFVNNAVQQIEISTTATLLYYVFDNEQPNGLNKTTGDHGTIRFKDKRVDAIKVVGGIEGQYFPEKMLAGKESDFNLPAFIWHKRKSTH